MIKFKFLFSLEMINFRNFPSSREKENLVSGCKWQFQGHKELERNYQPEKKNSGKEEAESPCFQFCQAGKIK
jgi:hypothetical protein